MKSIFKISLFSFALFIFTGMAWAQDKSMNLIPVPVSLEESDAEFSLDQSLKLAVNVDNEMLERRLSNFQETLKALNVVVERTEFTPDSLGVRGSQGEPLLYLALDSIGSDFGREGYTLKVVDQAIDLRANHEDGLFNGLMTLKQLLPVKRVSQDEGFEPIKIHGLQIEDYPRFAWRGLMLDVSRHFFTVDEVKAFIDQMAEYKFNVFHWHLTDDEGWRIEIKTFPKLTEVGAWRVERHGRFGSDRPYPKKGEKSSYGGFYTQEQVKEVIAYAQERNITIVPEIDVPGHSMALLAAYPELSTRKEYKFVNPGSKFANWYGDGTFEMTIENMLDPSNPATYAFLDMIFGEIADLFPGEYIHMGGDECDHSYWEKSEKVQKFMEENKIKDSHELQSYFVKRVEKIISGKGKKMIGWDEILEGGLADGAAVMSWRSMEGGINAARSGHNVVMTPKSYTYLDYTQGDYSVENKIYADLDLERAYSFDPMPNPNLFVDIDPKYILGGQGNLWTEVVPNLPYAFYMAYPRAFALSESLWSPKANKDWTSFTGRVEQHFERFDLRGRNIAKTIQEPKIKVYKEGNKLMCALSTPYEDISFFYTVDNTYPISFGETYSEPFEIPAGDLSLRVQSYRAGKPVGRLLQIHRKDLEKRVK